MGVKRDEKWLLYIQGIRAEYEGEIARLKQRDEDTGKMILPIIGYMQEEGGADKWGIKPGQQIFKKILEILKTQKPC